MTKRAAPRAHRREPGVDRGLPWWVKGIAYDAADDVVELRAQVYIDGVQLQCGPAGTPPAAGARVVAVRFAMKPSEARALHKVLGRCVDASSAVLLEVES